MSTDDGTIGSPWWRSFKTTHDDRPTWASVEAGAHRAKRDTLPFVPGSDTSREAARDGQNVKRQTSVRARVFRLIEECPRTDDRLEEITGIRHETISARRRDLVLAGKVRDSGKRAKTRRGRAAVVWEVVPEEDREAEAEFAKGRATETKAEALRAYQLRAEQLLKQFPGEYEKMRFLGTFNDQVQKLLFNLAHYGK